MMTANVPLRDEIFAINRAIGRISLETKSVAGVTRRCRVHEAGSLRVRFPSGDAGSALEAVIVNTAGGMAGGDRFDVDVQVGAQARLTVTTAAAEKIYRSTGPDTRIGVALNVGPGGRLAWLPQETIMFDRARLRRSIDIALAPGAALLLAEAVVFGRSAMGETVNAGHFSDRWRLRIDGKFAFAETVRLDGEISQLLAQRAVAGNAVAVASVLKVPGDEAAVAAVRAVQRDFSGEVGVSAWNGFALARLVANDGASLRRDLFSVLMALGAETLPRLLLN